MKLLLFHIYALEVQKYNRPPMNVDKTIWSLEFCPDKSENAGVWRLARWRISLNSVGDTLAMKSGLASGRFDWRYDLLFFRESWNYVFKSFLGTLRVCDSALKSPVVRNPHVDKLLTADFCKLCNACSECWPSLVTSCLQFTLHFFDIDHQLLHLRINWNIFFGSEDLRRIFRVSHAKLLLIERVRCGFFSHTSTWNFLGYSLLRKCTCLHVGVHQYWWSNYCDRRSRPELHSIGSRSPCSAFCKNDPSISLLMSNHWRYCSSLRKNAHKQASKQCSFDLHVYSTA